MARVAVQFVANSNMGAVTKDIAKINAQLAAMAHEMQKVGVANPKGLNSMMQTFRSDIANIKGYESATMSARTATSAMTEQINRQKATMKDLGKLRANDSRLLKEMAQEQMRLMNSSAMNMKRDLATGRVMGELIVPTDNYARSAKLAGIETRIMGNAMFSAGQQTEMLGKRMQWTGRQLSAGLSTPIIGVAALAAKAAYDIDDAMVRVEKVYGGLAGVTEEEMNRVKAATLDTAEKVVERFGISAKQTVNLAGELAAAGYEGARLQDTIVEIQRISMLGQLDQQKAMDATRTIQTVFGISTEELAHKFNFLNAVENETNTTLQDLTEVIPRTGGVVKSLGGSLEDTAIFTVAFKEAGIDAVQGANALRSSLGAIVGPSMVAQKRLKGLGIDIRQIAKENHPDNGGGGLVATLQALGKELEQLDELQKQEALSVLFGRYQFNKMGGLLKGLTEDANDTSTQVGSAFALTGASITELAEVADREERKIRESLSGRLRIAAQQVVLAFAEIGRPILAMVVPIVEKFAEMIELFNKLPSFIKGSVGAIALLLASAGPLLFFAGIFRVLYGNVFKLLGVILRGGKGFRTLLTASSTFSQHAMTAAIPAIEAQTGATAALGAAMAKAAAQMQLLTAANSKAAAGASAGAMAGVARPTRGGRLAGGSPNGTGGQKTAIVPPGATMLPIVPPRTANDIDKVNDGTDKAAKGAARLRGHWTGIASGIGLAALMIAPMVGDGGKATMIITGLAIALMLIPKQLGWIAKGLLRITGLTWVWGKMSGGAGGFTARLKAMVVAMRAAGGAAGILKIALASLAGPLGILLAGIAAIAVGMKWWKKEVKEAKAEANAMNTAAESLAGVIGFEYQKAQAGATYEAAKGAQTLHDQAAAWLETGDAAKLAAKQIEDAATIEKAANLARRIGLDALAHGANETQAFRAAKAAMLAGGYNVSDVQEQLKITDFVDKDAALKLEMEDTGKAFGQALSEGFRKGAKADQTLKDFGPKIAAQLNGKTRDEIFTGLTSLVEEFNDRAANSFSDIRLEEADIQILEEFEVNIGDMESVRAFFNDLPRLQEQGKIDSQLPQGLLQMGEAARIAAEKEAILVNAMKEAAKYTGQHYNEINTLAEYRELASGLTEDQITAEKRYTEAISTAKQEHNRMNIALANAGKATYNWTEAQELAILNQHRLKRGLPPTTDLTLGFGLAAEEAAAGVSELDKQMEGIDPNAFKDKMKSAMQGEMNDLVGMLMSQFDDATAAYKDSVSKQNQIWQDGFEARKDANDKEFEDRQRKEEKAFERQEKAMDARHDKMLEDAEKQKNSRIKAIEDEMDKADKLDEQRKKMFEAEKTRIQRLSAAANRNIDFNVALKTGNLDEAARLQEAAYAEEISNAMDDAESGMDAESERRRAAGEKKIQGVTTAEDARIKRIQSVIDKEKEAFNETKQRAADALQDAKDKANQRFEAEKRAYEETAKAAERAYDRTRAARRKQVEESLQLVAKEVPTNVQEYQKMFGTLSAEYQKQTGVAAQKTTEWNNKHREGFHKAMEITFRELQNDAKWAAVGSDSVDSMIQGMLGMTFAEFANWMATGVIPKKVATLRPNVGGGTNPNKIGGEGSIGGRHSGGMVDETIGDRAGRPMDAPLYPDEVKTILQKGEFVVKKDAVDKIGPATLQRINEGQTSFFHEGGMVGAAGGKIMSTFQSAIGLAVQRGAARKAQEIAAAGNLDGLPDALKYVAQAAMAGKYASTQLTDEQLRNAATIIGVGRRMGANNKELTVAIMAALESSRLRNASPEGDKVGLFGQRASDGWGPIDKLIDPNYASSKFFGAMLNVKGRADMGLGQLARLVQRAKGGDYERWQDEAEAILKAPIGGAGFAGAAGATPGYNGGGTFSAHGGRVTGDIQGLQMEFLNRLARWSAALGQPYNVGSGYRSMAEQQILYNRWLARVPGQAPAAPPGRSNHNFGLASDGPRWGGKNPEQFGLHYPMSYEPWHIEPIGAKAMRVPQLNVGGTVNYDDTIANLHKNETVLTAPLSQKLNDGIEKLDSGSNVQYNINVYGAGADADTVANKVMQKIQRMEQVKGPKRVIR